MTAVGPFIILCMYPKRDMVVECQQLSTAYMSHIQPVFGDGKKIDTTIQIQNSS
jgi:hypothetical protein